MLCTWPSGLNFEAIGGFIVYYLSNFKDKLLYMGTLSWLNVEHSKEHIPPLRQTCKVLRPWAMFHKTTSWASPPYTFTSHPPCVTWKVFPGLFHFFCPSPTFMYYTESRLKNKNGGDMGTRLKKRHSTYYKLCKYNCLAKATLQTCWSTFSTYFRYRVTPVNVLKNSTLAIRAVTANLVCKDT